MQRNSKIKVILSIIGILTGALFFRVGHKLIKQVENNKNHSVTEFWDLKIKIRGGDKLNITPEYLFKTMPTLEEYPKDNIVYFNYINSRRDGSKVVITSTIIQNGEVLFKNQYYFQQSSDFVLNKILNQDISTGELTEITDPREIKSLVEIYSEFIYIWLLNQPPQ